MSMYILYRVQHYIYIPMYIIYDVCTVYMYVVFIFYFSSGWQQRRRFRFSTSAAVRHRDTAGWTTSKGEGEHHTCI